MVMKLQIFMIEKFLRLTHTCLAVIILDFDLMKDENYYLQVFLKKCKHIEKK